ncbi:hypothetical protein EDD18DRAFT_1100426 [Armillaria luteobubalina]|uniref:Uncharacterized protein n=1 Tax=Armillaria luteobubalina TaxID=153913 RepID=A0AA39QFE7_9AGAR|nr:hypothetical protein EDD18DRAFT_1100426 [Armillaria luteobubalina]
MGTFVFNDSYPFQLLEQAPLHNIPVISRHRNRYWYCQGACFGKAMKGWGDSSKLQFLWESLCDGTIVYDLGGISAISMQLADAHHSLCIMLQDLPSHIEMVKNEVWPKLCSVAIADGRVQFKTINFFLESPVKDCDICFSFKTEKYPEQRQHKITEDLRAPNNKIDSWTLKH